MPLKVQSETKRIFSYTWDFYRQKLVYIIAFSIPLFIAWVILLTVQAPTYSAMGAPYLRTGSLPDLTEMDIIFIGLGYFIAAVIFAETFVNINLLIKSKRRPRVPTTSFFKFIFLIFILPKLSFINSLISLKSIALVPSSYKQIDLGILKSIFTFSDFLERLKLHQQLFYQKATSLQMSVPFLVGQMW